MRRIFLPSPGRERWARARSAARSEGVQRDEPRPARPFWHAPTSCRASRPRPAVLFRPFMPSGTRRGRSPGAGKARSYRFAPSSRPRSKTPPAAHRSPLRPPAPPLRASLHALPRPRTGATAPAHPWHTRGPASRQRTQGTGDRALARPHVHAGGRKAARGTLRPDGRPRALTPRGVASRHGTHPKADPVSRCGAGRVTPIRHIPLARIAFTRRQK